jgi:hypothetical protein
VEAVGDVAASRLTRTWSERWKVVRMVPYVHLLQAVVAAFEKCPLVGIASLCHSMLVKNQFQVRVRFITVPWQTQMHFLRLPDYPVPQRVISATNIIAFAANECRLAPINGSSLVETGCGKYCTDIRVPVYH